MHGCQTIPPTHHLPTHPPVLPACRSPGVKYAVKAVRQGPQTLRLHLGGTHVDVVVRKLNDGGLLVQVRGGPLSVASVPGMARGRRCMVGRSAVLHCAACTHMMAQLAMCWDCSHAG